MSGVQIFIVEYIWLHEGSSASSYEQL